MMRAKMTFAEGLRRGRTDNTRGGGRGTSIHCCDYYMINLLNWRELRELAGREAVYS